MSAVQNSSFTRSHPFSNRGETRYEGTVLLSSQRPCTSCNVFSCWQRPAFGGLRAVGLVHNVGVNKLTADVNFNKREINRIGISPRSRGRKGVVVCGMNLVFVAAEVSPWSKTGGLGDVMGGLPPAMAARGHRVMTVAPRYDQYKDAWDTSTTISIKVGDRTEIVRYFHVYKRGVDRVFVDHPLFLAKVWGKTGGKIYGPEAGEDYHDNQLRFSLLAQAAIEAPRVLNLTANEYFNGPYGENVLFIANDWHTAVLPSYLKTLYKAYGQFINAKVAFCVHNVAYQGRFAYQDFDLLNLPEDYEASFDFIDGYDTPVKGRKINWMKAGFLQCDLALTVSPSYAQELTSGPDKGVELDEVIKRIGIIGITNGMDVQEWDPSTDKYLAVRYNLNTVLEAKPVLKEALQAEVGLPINPEVPLIGFIGRLEEQKGSDILAEAVADFMDEDVQLVVLGTGKKIYEEQLKRLEIDYPNKARGIVKFNVPLAHMITAGADFMLVPSRFEPCGLIQLHAMRYGTIPVVSSTGGLVDTVKEGVTGFHMGAFNVHCETIDPLDVVAIAATVKRAIRVYKTSSFPSMIQAAMSQDLSWKGPARRWEEVLLNLAGAHGSPGQEGVEIAPRAKYNLATP